MNLVNVLLKKYFWGVILAFLATSAYLTAGIFTGAVNAKLQSAAPATLATSSERPKPPPARADMLRTIVDRSLFNSAAVGSRLVGRSNGEAVETDLNVELQGTVIWGSSGRWAMITDRASKETQVYSEGDALLADATVVSIESGVVTIDRNGERQVLRQLPYGSGIASLTGGATSGRARPGAGAALDGDSVKEIGDGEFVVQRDLIDQMIENPAAMAGQIRGRPVEDGFKFGRVPNNSPLAQMGIKRGDVVTSINGRPANNTAELLKLLTELGNTESVSIEVERDGQTIPLNITLR